MALSSAEIAYRRRLKMAAAMSLLLHMSFVFIAIINPGSCANKSLGMTPKQDPLIVHLQPQDPLERRRLVDPSTPANTPVAPTDLIAETDSNAQDTSDAQGDPHTPDLAETDAFENLGAPPVETPPPSPPVLPAPPITGAPKTTEASVTVESPVKAEPDRAPAPIQAAAPKRDDQAEETAFAEKNVPAAPEPMDLAKAEVPPLVLDNPSRTRKPGGVEAEGFANFEAKQHELAPYLKNIRERVEREWRNALRMNYSGMRSTTAVIECAISPDGELVEVTIVEPGKSVTFGPLCKDAIVRAAPFGKFPFEVPDIYQNENLQIRWTFSFM